MQDSDAACEALRALRKVDYSALSVAHKLRLLRTLADGLLSLETVHTLLTDNFDRQRDLLKTRAQADAATRKEINALSAQPLSDKTHVHHTSSGTDEKLAEAAPPPWSEYVSDDEADAKAQLTEREHFDATRATRAQATERLLCAISARDEAELEEAVEHAAKEGHAGKLDDGRPWLTDELRTAHKLLHDMQSQKLRDKQMAQLKRRDTKAFDAYRLSVGRHPVREEPIGIDSRGRKYWAFVHDPLRLWVQAPEGAESWTWAFYDTAASVQAVLDSLDGRLEGEAAFKKTLRELLPTLTKEMAAEEVTNTEEGWMGEGHEYIDRRVLRFFDGAGSSTGKITRWLPADEETGDPALFHVVHDADGDQEDLEQEEATQAIADYDDQQERGGGVEAAAALEQPKYANMYEKKASRVVVGNLGLAGARSELLELEDSITNRLRAAGSRWDSDELDRDTWLLSCRHSESLVELAQLLVGLEGNVRVLQSAPDVHERKPWRTEGHPFIGKPSRRFFHAYGASDGLIVGWLPAEGVDPPLWHMVHGDDADEEDLDEQEATFALHNFAENRAEPTTAELEYAATFAAAAAEEADEEAAGLDDDGDERLAPTDRLVPRGGSATKSSAPRAGSSRRLWSSKECRERWLSTLQQPSSAAALSLAIAAFRQHCAAFGALPADIKAGKVRRDEMQFQLSSWVHAKAFADTGKGKGKKKK
uniref:WHIM2 domain-containing protein n=1 Tax=Calcidiscus leptoporus TaxID=127549 RepID=A0A7S0P1L2_9EUKA